MNESEHTEQVNLMKWWHLACHGFGIPEECLFAIPNGGHRNIVVASKLKAEGVRAGVPDLFLAVSRNGNNGLFIEMKKIKGGRVSAKQNDMMQTLSEQGFCTVVCHGWIQAKTSIESYLCR